MFTAWQWREGRMYSNWQGKEGPNMIIIEHQHSTLRNRMAHRRMIRSMASSVIPTDKSWQVLLPLIAMWITIAVLFVRWWAI